MPVLTKSIPRYAFYKVLEARPTVLVDDACCNLTQATCWPIPHTHDAKGQAITARDAIAAQTHPHYLLPMYVLNPHTKRNSGCGFSADECLWNDLKLRRYKMPLRNRLLLPKAKESRRSRALDVAGGRQKGHAPDWLTASHWNKHRL